MSKFFATTTFGLGGQRATESVFSKNHFASEAALSPEVKAKIASMGLYRVAGNSWVNPSSADFWTVKGNKIIKLVGGDEVDNGETLAAAPSNNPSMFLSSIMDDLSF